MDKASIKKYDINLAAEFHVLSILRRLGHEATLALGHKATIALGNNKDVDIVVFKPDGRIAKIDSTHSLRHGSMLFLVSKTTSIFIYFPFSLLPIILISIYIMFSVCSNIMTCYRKLDQHTLTL